MWKWPWVGGGVESCAATAAGAARRAAAAIRERGATATARAYGRSPAAVSARRVDARLPLLVESEDVVRAGARDVHPGRRARHPGHRETGRGRALPQQPPDQVGRDVPFHEVAADQGRVT